MGRLIVLDTETTGFAPHLGHRLVEIGAVELIDHQPTGREFHTYLDPEREVPADAARVHGLTTAFLRGKPKFTDPEVSGALLAFIDGARIVAHRAEFDRAFINLELEFSGRERIEDGRWIDTLALARSRLPGGKHNLDTLCARLGVSCATRTRHGALTDARLLASAYQRLVTYQEPAQAAPEGFSQRPAARRYRPGSQAWPDPRRR
jgi:DNA polymerase-3 subunit epsilon